MANSSRRSFLATSVWLLAASGASGLVKRGCSLSIGTYSLKGMALEAAISLVKTIGFDGLEIATQPGFDGEPSKLMGERRREIRKRLIDSNLRLTALMEQITPSVTDKENASHVIRLGRVAELARDLASDPATPPLIQTVLGGGTWDEKKNLFRDRLGSWVDTTKAGKVVLAIKPHRGGAL